MERVLDPRDYGTFGLGCWAIGSPFSDVDSAALGWGEVADDEPGRPMKVFLSLPNDIVEDDDTLSEWIGRAQAQAAKLPPKKPKAKKA